jgi:hypothetical protein
VDKSIEISVKCRKGLAKFVKVRGD